VILHLTTFPSLFLFVRIYDTKYTLDEEVMLHWNAPPLHSADLVITGSLNDYFSQKKESQWLFHKKKVNNMKFGNLFLLAQLF